MLFKARLFCFSVVFLVSIHLAAQQTKVDSLQLVLAQRSDTSQIGLLLQISDAYLGFSAKKALEPAAEARMMAVQAGDERKEAIALVAMGKAYSRAGNMEEAIPCFNQAVDLTRKVGALSEVGDILINVGNAFNDAGYYDDALTTSLDAYKIFEQAKDKGGMSRSLIVSGNVYRLLRKYDKAADDYNKALALAREANRPELEASCLNNLAIVYGDTGDHRAALNYLRQAKKIYEETNNSYSLARVFNNMGAEYFEMGMSDSITSIQVSQLDTATQFYLLALELRKTIGDKRGQASTLSNLGSVSLAQNNPDKSIDYFLRALVLAKDIRSLDLQMQIYQSLHEAYIYKDDTDKALEYFKEYSDIKDTIYNAGMSQSIAEMQALFDVEKAEAATRATEEQKKLIIWSSVIGGILFIVIIFFIWRQSTDRKRVNIALNAQKQEIEKKNVALNDANHEIELKNKDITDSIRYARRIQEAILPELEFATTFGKSGFVLYKPKDIVSGDFYWMARRGDLILFAAVDCTGHGVPGAFVSIVCSNLLNQAVNEHGFHEPDDILNDVNARLSVTLRQRVDESKVRDGMDIALCCMNTSTGMLRFAGAFNPAWILRNNELIELKADKFPVGNFEDEALRRFVRQEIQLEKGDRVYVFSDGYSDQFGGPNGKKYKRVQFISFLKKIQSYPVHEHKGLLEREHLAWRGELEQIDDIVVMGVEFPVNS